MSIEELLDEPYCSELILINDDPHTLLDVLRVVHEPHAEEVALASLDGYAFPLELFLIDDEELSG